MTRDELLLQLRDIRAPAEPAWWLPAPAHLVAGLALLSLVAIIAIWMLHRRGDRKLIAARRELRFIAAEHADDGDTLRLAQALAPWLKRIALQAFPGQRLEGVTGDAWLEFLDSGIGGDEFSRGVGSVFGADIYRPAPVFRGNAEALLELCERWLSGIAPRLRGMRG